MALLRPQRAIRLQRNASLLRKWSVASNRKSMGQVRPVRRFAQYGPRFRQSGTGQPAALSRPSSAHGSIRHRLSGAGQSGPSRSDEQLVPDHALCIGHSARSRPYFAARAGRMGLFRRPGLGGRSRGHHKDTQEDRCAAGHRQALPQGHLGRHPSDQSRHCRDGCHRRRHQGAGMGGVDRPESADRLASFS